MVRMMACSLATAALVGAGGAHRARAQGPSDETRFVIGVSAGWIAGGGLWSVSDQPYQPPAGPGDTGPPPPLQHLDIMRRIEPSFTFTAGFVRFIGDHVGIAGEFSYLGLGYRDSMSTDKSPTHISNSANSIAAGIIYRLGPRQRLQPYVLVQGGVTLVSNSSRAYGFGNALAATKIYADPSWIETRPTVDLAFGVSTSANGWMQWRLEARGTGLALSEVTGTTSQGAMPPSRTAFKLFPSITLGIDLILSRSVSTRY
jgi:hypothetical protein